MGAGHFYCINQQSIMSDMTSEPTKPSVLPSGPSKHENLVGAILWLLPPDQVPDHGRYKLKAKACGHPCVVVQDCRATDPDFVRICILASYSHSISYNSLGISEQHDHVPIHPNRPDSRVQPSILYLRPRQRTEMLLKRRSWVNTRRVYKVPISILRPYETFQSWCRYRLNESSIQALQSALLISALESAPVCGPTQYLSSPVLSEGRSFQEGALSSPDIPWSPFEKGSQDLFSQQMPATLSDDPMYDEPATASSQSQIQLPASGENDSGNAPSGHVDTQGSDKPCVPLSDRQSPFHMILPFDAGPHPRSRTEGEDLSVTSPLLPPPVTNNKTRPRHRLQRRGQSIVRICGVFVVVSFVVVLILRQRKP